jgi:hypothetical protein
MIIKTNRHIIKIFLIFVLFAIYIYTIINTKNDWDDINEILEYYFMDYILKLLNLIKNTKIQQILYEIKYNPDIIKSTKLYSLCNNYKYLSNNNYNRYINIDEINNYTILKFNIDFSKTLKQMVKQCLENILNNKKIYLNNESIKLDDCILLDIFNSGVTKFNAFHTDIEYSIFTGNAFNVWYLIENNETFGNMFLLETPEYKKEYTPCFLVDEYKDNFIPINKNSYIDAITNNYKNIGYFNQNNIKITYTNMKNGECLIMSKHLLHRTDLSRTENFKGFNFRVIIKNKDGSIDYKHNYTKIKPYHIYDEKNHKIYGCKLFDFI